MSDLKDSQETRLIFEHQNQLSSSNNSSFRANGYSSVSQAVGHGDQAKEGTEKELYQDVEIECEHDRLIKTVPERDLSNSKTFMHLFKVFTGPSTMGMPVVIKNGGLLFGTVGFFLVGYLNMHCNITVVKCCRILRERTGKTATCYEDLMEDAFLLHSDKVIFRKTTTAIRKLTVLMLILCQFGILSFYFQIIGSVIQEKLEATGNYNYPMQLTELFVCLLIIPYSWMRNLRILSWFSSVANILNIVCFATILQLACKNLLPISSLPLVTRDPWTIPLFVGAAVYTVEGIPMILPLENKVKHQDAYAGCCGLITLATTVNICLNSAMGFYGYLAFGDDVPGNILVALPDEWTYGLVTLLYALMVFLTFTLQLYLPAEVIGSSLKQRFKAAWVQKYGDMLTRTLVVICAYLFAALIPKIDLLMSLVGAFTTVTLVFIFPPMAELLILQKEPGGVPWYYVIKDVAIFIFGAIAFLTGTYMSIQEIVLSF